MRNRRKMLLLLAKKKSGGGSIWKQITGSSPLTLLNAKNSILRKLKQYGKCTQASTPTPSSPVDIKCNNGAIKVSANLLDPTAVPNENKYITSHSGGESTPGSGTFRHSGYIRIVGGEKYFFGMKPYLASTAGLAWYSEPNLGSYISGVSGTSLKNAGMVATAPASANYVRFSWMTSSGYDTDWQNSVYICVNGLMSAFRAFGEVYIDGTPEVLTVSASGAETQTASVENLFAVGDYKDEQDIISGAVTRRCAVCLYDGTQSVGDIYLSTTGGKDNGAIIVYPKGTNYSGAIASFDFDEEDNELGALSVAIEPIQDLNGYDNPWPSGGGKNKFDSSLMANAVEATKYITLNLKPNTEYTMSSDDPSKDGGTYADLFFCNVGESTNSKTNGVKLNQPVTRTSDENGQLRVWYRRYKTWITPEQLIAYHTQVEEGSTATAWTPYSNECPIYGHTDADVTRTGKNLIPSIDDTAFWDTSGFFNKNGTITVRTNYKTSTYLPVIGGCQYVFSTFNENGTIISGWKGLLVYDSNKQPLQDTFYENNVTKIAITIPDEGSYIRMYTILANNITYQQLELGSTASDYSPYVGTTYPIPLGQTVYGGTLDVVNGKMYARPYYPSYNGETLVGPWISSMDKYEEGATPTTGAQVVDMGGTVTEIFLTPEEITLLEGENNIWSDAGEISVLVLEPTTESVTPQELHSYAGDTTVSWTAEVDGTVKTVEYAQGKQASNKVGTAKAGIAKAG